MSRLATLALTFLLAAMTLSTAETAEPHEEWLQYLQGEWTYEWADLGIKGEYKANLGAKRHALISRGKAEDGAWVEIWGWRSDSKTLVNTGYGSRGDYWYNESSNITADVIRGKGHGVLPDGRAYKGTSTRKRVNDDQFEIHFKGTADGEELTVIGKFARKN